MAAWAAVACWLPLKGRLFASNQRHADHKQIQIARMLLLPPVCGSQLCCLAALARVICPRLPELRLLPPGKTSQPDA